MFLCRDKLDIFSSLFMRKKKRRRTERNERGKRGEEEIRKNNNAARFSFMCIKSFPFFHLINILKEVKLRRDLSYFRGPPDGTDNVLFLRLLSRDLVVKS